MMSSISKAEQGKPKVNSEGAALNDAQCLELRKLLHELSNVTTGMLISAGLLERLLTGDARHRYCEQINQAGERTAVLVREARALLRPAEPPKVLRTVLVQSGEDNQ